MELKGDTSIATIEINAILARRPLLKIYQYNNKGIVDVTISREHDHYNQKNKSIVLVSLERKIDGEVNKLVLGNSFKVLIV